MNQAQTRLPSPIPLGILATALMLVLYFVVVGLISGLAFAAQQFAEFWYFLLALAVGFGVQAGLFSQLKRLAGAHGASGRVMATTGATSTATMVSCCAHYLVNVLPVMGITGFLTLVAQYQIELFWLGLAFNAVGIAFISSRVIRAGKEHRK